MYDRILGRFLVDAQRITEEQLQEAIDTQDSIRVKLGVIAISEKLMTIEQTEEINALQAKKDKRFGDLAIEKEYLTEEQVKKLLGLQGNEYLIFIQTLLDKHFITMETLDVALEDYRKVHGFMESEMNTLKSGDIDKIVPMFLTMENPLCRQLFVYAVKTIYRLVDSHVAISESYKTACIHVDTLGYQKLIGSHEGFMGISGNIDPIIKMALAYTKETFVENSEDALDAICELINCTNGIFATKLSQERIEVDMEPPVYSAFPKEVKGKDLYVLPLIVCGEKIDLLISIDHTISID
ncbi:MAG: chemotaxis protein CheX [Lachnospiraceae bacterium]